MQGNQGKSESGKPPERPLDFAALALGLSVGALIGIRIAKN